MKRRLFVILGILLCLTCYAENIARVAILDIVDKTSSVPYAQKLLLRSCLTTSISLSPGYEGFDRINLSGILQEQNFQRTGFVSSEQVHKLGEMTGASYILIAEAAPYDGNNLIVAAQILDVETARVTNSSETVCPLNPATAMREECIKMAQFLLGEKQGLHLSGPDVKGRSSSHKSDYTESAYGINMEMVYVQGGEFLMGGTSEQGSNAESDEQVIRQVNVGDFYIGRFEVTQSQWESVMGTSVSQQRNKANPQWPLPGTGPNYPMYYVSWEEASEFCRILSRKTGKTYRLPTEAEWEYAARGGQKSDGTKYSGSNLIDYAGWYNGNSASSAHPVGTKSPNELGICDMSGNVWEWCSDWYSDNYDRNQTDNPTGPVYGSCRVLRGGGWNHDATHCRVSDRNYNSPGNRYNNYGFRVVCLP